MKSPKSFEKIAILEIWQVSKLTSAFYPWNDAFSSMEKIDFHKYIPVIVTDLTT